MNFNVLWKGDWLTVISPHKYPYEAVHEINLAVVLPIIKTKSGPPIFVIRKELCPPYTVYGGDRRFYTVLSGGIEGQETASAAMLREMQEEAGLVVEDYRVLYRKHMPVCKVSTSISHFHIIEVLDYKRIKPTNDGTKYEELSESVFTTQDMMEEIVTQDNVDFLLVGLYNIYKSLSK